MEHDDKVSVKLSTEDLENLRTALQGAVCLYTERPTEWPELNYQPCIDGIEQLLERLPPPAPGPFTCSVDPDERVLSARDFREELRQTLEPYRMSLKLTRSASEVARDVAEMQAKLDRLADKEEIIEHNGVTYYKRTLTPEEGQRLMVDILKARSTSVGFRIPAYRADPLPMACTQLQELSQDDLKAMARSWEEAQKRPAVDHENLDYQRQLDLERLLRQGAQLVADQPGTLGQAWLEEVRAVLGEGR